MTPSDNRIKISISQDQMEARLTIGGGRKDFPTPEEFAMALDNAGVVAGIDEALIKRITGEKLPVKDLVIASGIPAEVGQDAQLIWSVKTDHSKGPVITELGKADYKQFLRFEIVAKDQVLVSKLPPTDGRPGKSVTGRELSGRGSDIELRAGKNTTTSQDGLTIYAGTQGYIVWDNGAVSVDNVCRITGDVDYSTGNIRFDGTVTIDGDVRSGFRVEATDSIHIRGNVGASDIYSQRGDVIIDRGILGKGKAKILAGGSLRCGFIQDATAGAKENAVIGRYCINSNLSAGRKVVLRSNEGLIRGGRVFAEEGLEAINIGSRQSIPTEVSIGEHGTVGIDSERWELRGRIDDINSRLSALKKRKSFIHLLRDRLPILSPERQTELGEIEAQTRILKRQASDLEKVERQLLDTWDQDLKREISVFGRVFPEVRIAIGDLVVHTDQVWDRVRILRAKDGIKLEPLPVISNAPHNFLIIYPDEEIVEKLSTAVETKEQEVTAMTDPGAALDLLKRREFDVILMGDILPESEDIQNLMESSGSAFVIHLNGRPAGENTDENTAGCNVFEVLNLPLDDNEIELVLTKTIEQASLVNAGHSSA